MVHQQAAGHPVGVENKFDPGSTTAVRVHSPGVAWLPRVIREKLTPAIAWSVFAALVGALVIAITWLVTTQSDIHQLKEAVLESKKSVAELRQELELLHKIDTRLAVMDSKMDGIATEVDRERARWDRVESVAAETPPHARKRR